jgi:DNA-binding beta-propeller fold protein YncE
MQNLIGAVLAILLAFTLRMPVAQAAAFNIAAGDVSGLVTAINMANANGVANTINLSGGAYTLTSVNNTRWEGPNGLPPITSDLTINGYLGTDSATGTMIARSAAPGTPSFRIFSVISGKLTVNNLTVSGGLQTGSVGGGALFNGGGTVTIVATTISGSRASEGGGILNYFGTLTIVNSTISGNETTSTNANSNGGAGVLNFSGRLNVVSSTFAYHREQQGRGHSIADAFSPPGFVNIKNSILSGASAGAACNGFSAGVAVSHGRNIARDNSCALNGPGDISNVAPMVNDLADNGGPTRTHALLPASPAINIIPLAACTDLNGAAIAKDQRGKARPLGGSCDSGAVERVPITLIATIPVDNPQGIAVDPDKSQVYVASHKSSPPELLVVINEDLLAVIDNRSISSSRTDSSGVAVDTNTHRVFVTNFFSPYTVTAFEWNSSTPYASTGVPVTHPMGITVDPYTGRVYVVGNWHGRVAVLDGTAANSLPVLTSTPIQLPSGTFYYLSAAFDLQSRRVYVPDPTKGWLGVINGAAGVPTGVSGTVPAGPQSRLVAVNHKTGIAYVTNNQSPWTFTAVNLSTNTIVAQKNLAAYPLGVAVNPETNRVYVVTNGTDRLYAIDGSSHDVIGYVPTGGVSSGGVAVNPKNNRAYVTNNANPGSVTVFDLGDP